MPDDGVSCDRHHLVPSSRGGRETEHLHRVCHRKIHATFTNKQLESEFNTVDALLGHDDIVRFVAWVSKKDPTYYDKTDDTIFIKKRKGRR